MYESVVDFSDPEMDQACEEMTKELGGRKVGWEIFRVGGFQRYRFIIREYKVYVKIGWLSKIEYTYKHDSSFRDPDPTHPAYRKSGPEKVLHAWKKDEHLARLFLTLLIQHKIARSDTTLKLH